MCEHCLKGVGAGGVLDIKAALYRQQQQAHQAQEDPSIAAERKSRKTAGVDVSLLVRRNAGVEARDQRDRDQIQARRPQPCMPPSASSKPTHACFTGDRLQQAKV